MPGMRPDSVSELLQEWRRGDQSAYDRLVPLIYTELRRLAQAHMRVERFAHSLQPTVLVHEAYLRLADADLGWSDRTHFLSVASRVMRRILVEHARARGARKRGGDEVHVTLTGDIPSPQASQVDVLVLDDAIERLRRLHQRQADTIELCYFGGLTHAEIGEALGVSEATVERDLRHGRAWLRRALSGAQA